MKLVARGATWSWPRLPLIMGIVNLCHDSFCHDGIIDVDEAVKLARTLVADGADIIDVGAESARTNRAVMEESEEAGKLCEFIERWQEPVPLSINTWRPAVVSATLSFGGAILNDIGGPRRRSQRTGLCGNRRRLADHAHARRAEGRAYACAV
jgi:dihydropteroate synthase